MEGTRRRVRSRESRVARARTNPMPLNWGNPRTPKIVADSSWVAMLITQLSAGPGWLVG